MRTHPFHPAPHLRHRVLAGMNTWSRQLDDPPAAVIGRSDEPGLPQGQVAPLR